MVDEYRRFGPAMFAEGKEERNEDVINGVLNGFSLRNFFPFFSKKKAALSMTCLSITPNELKADSLDEYMKRKFKRYLRELKEQEIKDREAPATSLHNGDTTDNNDVMSHPAESADDGSHNVLDNDGHSADNVEDNNGVDEDEEDIF